MDPTPTPSEQPDESPDPWAGRRSREADLVEEARIARAGGGVARISPYYQALLYLLLLAVLVVAVWLSWRW